jgi:hypothetical protein
VTCEGTEGVWVVLTKHVLTIPRHVGRYEDLKTYPGNEKPALSDNDQSGHIQTNRDPPSRMVI